VTPLPYQPISYLEWNAARRGSSAAIWEGGAEITFEELLGHVRRIQKLLAARGVREGDVVGVRLPNVWQYVALELAIPDLGAVIVPFLAFLAAIVLLLPALLPAHWLCHIRSRCCRLCRER